MTFLEYCNQKNPRYNPFVYIYEKDLHSKPIFTAIPNTFIMVLKIHGKRFLYIINKDSNIFYTMDEDGNKKSSSVFCWRDKNLFKH